MLHFSIISKGDKDEIKRVEELRSNNNAKSTSWSATKISSVIRDFSCAEYLRERAYINASTANELYYPLAYSIIVHKKAGQVERLLQTIYRPQNVYCIHIDAKADADFYDAFKNIASCLPNVILSKKREDVNWGGYSRLAADFNCMQELLAVSWKECKKSIFSSMKYNGNI